MGDEMHQRNVAASSLLARTLMPHVARVGDRHHAVARFAEFVAGNDQFFLNVAMAAGKALADPAGGVAHSTIVTAMARNGTDFGLRVSGLGDRWFTAPVETPVGLYFPGFTADDANPDIPALDERGVPAGIDVRRVLETGIAPLINTGIAGKQAGTGQIGAGVARAPLACFERALEALAARAEAAP